jgi:hypothetical protein
VACLVQQPAAVTLRWLLSLPLACTLVLGAGSPSAVAAPRDKTAIHRKLTDEKAFRGYLLKRQDRVMKSEHLWTALARRLMPAPGATLKPIASVKQAQQLFTQMRDAELGTNIPLDGCAPRADLAALAAMRAGFAVQKVNYFSVGGPLTVKKDGKTLEWDRHVAVAVQVKGAGGKTRLAVIDPTLFDRPVTVETWESKMIAKHGIRVVTGPDQLTSEHPELSGEARVRQLAYNLAAVSGLRQFERSASATAAVATPSP